MSSSELVRVEATQIQAHDKTYGWIIAIRDRMVTLMVARGVREALLVEDDEDYDPAFDEMYDLPRTVLRVGAVMTRLGVTKYDSRVLTQYFWVPESLYRRFSDFDETVRDNTINELFALFGLSLLGGME